MGRAPGAGIPFCLVCRLQTVCVGIPVFFLSFKMAKIYSVKNSVNLWARWTVPGHKETRKTTGIATKRLAQIKANDMERADIEAKRLATIGIVTFEEMYAWDVERAQRGTTKQEEFQTWRFYWKHVKSYFKCPSEINARSIDDYIAYRRSQLIRGKRVPSNVSIRHELRVMKRGIKAAQRYDRAEGLDTRVDSWSKLQTDGAQKLETQTAKLRHTHAEIVAWLLELKGEAQAEAILSLLTGMRDGEMRRTTLDMLDVKEGVLVLNVPAEKKRAVDRQVAITPFVHGLMKRFLPFKQLHKQARRYAAKRLGFADWVHPPHLRNMRGLFMSVAHQGGFSEAYIKWVSGHGRDETSHHLYVTPTPTMMKTISAFVESYWAPKLQAAFARLSAGDS